ncbi:D-alanyl-D-alanine carboxypeptidase [Candidatus Beckwithbacteria bacterium]|nr:D-alanyl-D-alanine carboxypeptidase [Candidatus Beckwithbacteria bacterium]
MKRLFSNNLRIILFILIFLSCLTIPSTFVYSFPNLEKKELPFRQINIEVPATQLYPVKITNTEEPYLSAKSVIAVDVDSKAVIYQRNPDERLYPASTTKMMTALIARQEYPLDKIASISSPLRDGQVIGLYQDEQISIENLLYGMLVYSGNDAAQALADIHPKGSDYFIQLMNQKVEKLGLTDTNFVNPTGLENYQHFSSVHDLAIIGTEIVKDPILSKIVDTKEITIYDQSGKIAHHLESINELLGVVPGLKGIKTGWTESSGECLVAYVERDDKKVITVLLGSFNRFGETQKLIEWIFANFEWEEIGI